MLPAWTLNQVQSPKSLQNNWQFILPAAVFCAGFKQNQRQRGILLVFFRSDRKVKFSPLRRAGIGHFKTFVQFVMAVFNDPTETGLEDLRLATYAIERVIELVDIDVLKPRVGICRWFFGFGLGSGRWHLRRIVFANRIVFARFCAACNQ